METWISRDKRKSKSFSRAGLIALLLLIITIGLYSWKYYPRIFKVKAVKTIVADKPPLTSSAQIDSFLTSILSELRLDADNVKLQPLNHNRQKVSYPCFRLAWPKDFPAIWFTERFQRQADSIGGLTYEAIESPGGDGLLAWLIAAQSEDTLAEMELVPLSGVSPGMSSIEFLFDDFADFRSQEALELIWLDIPIGYILQADQIPNDKLIKALKSSPCQGILDIPTDSIGWALVLSAHKIAKTIPDSRLSEANVRSILGVVPGLSGFFLKTDSLTDRSLVKLIINQAEALHLTYLYSRDTAGYADSLAYLKGMKIKSLDNYVDCRRLTQDELRQQIIDRANDFSLDDKGLFLVSSDVESVEAIKSLEKLFSRLNIVIAPPLRTASTIEGL